MKIKVTDIAFDCWVEVPLPERHGEKRFTVKVQFEDSVHLYDTTLSLLEHEITPESIIYLIGIIYQRQIKNQQRIDTLNTAIINLQEGLQGA